VTSLSKKQSRRNPGNYKGISITNTFNRLFAKIIHDKLHEASKHIMNKDQNGFSLAQRCVYNLFIVQQVRKKKRTARREKTHDITYDLY